MKETLSGHYINQQWTAGAGNPFQSVNPATGEMIWQGTEANHQEIAMAYEGAHNALTSWRKRPYSERAAFLLNFAQQVEKRKQALTHQISLETGKPLWESATEVGSVIAKINLSIKAFEARCPETHTESNDVTNSLRYQSLGVMAVLGPYNFPAHLSNGHIVPALLAGNTVIYKPSELTPGVAELIMQCWHDSGIPSGVIQCVQGGMNSAKALLDCDVQGVLFTGSYQTGVKINQQLSHRPEVLLALEMGGNNPLIIDTLNDISAAVYHAVLSTMITTGQRCTCVRRLMIPNNATGEAFLNQFVVACKTLKVGAFSSTPEPFMGPVIRYEHALSHLRKQQGLIDKGGKAVLAMSLLQPNTGFLSPGIIDMTDVDNPLDEEIFAPLVQVYRYDDFEQALKIANQTRYGLAAGLFSTSRERYQQFYDSIHAGLINWNKPTTGASSALPFGGVGKSGNYRPSAYFAADYCAYPIASMEQMTLTLPETKPPGMLY